MAFTHGGSGSGYANYACRCEACVIAHRERVARRRAQRKAEGEPPPYVEHGASAYKNWGCRCQVCTEANSVACKEYRRGVVAS